MMTVNIICVGKLKEQYLKDGCAEYIKRLSPFAKINVVEIAEERCADEPSEAQIRSVVEKEGERIIAKLPKSGAIIPLCIEGTEFSSAEFSKRLEKISLENSTITFIIGGSFGLSEKVKNSGNPKLSFGRLTLPHQLARLVLLEQIYRAFSISANSKYHK